MLCGPGIDTAMADPIDFVDPSSCETVRRVDLTPFPRPVLL
jgi:hypothetical protein